MIIDFGKNGGGNMSNYWNSAVTEEHIESAASITYASATSYTDQALEDIDLSEYWTSAQTESAITMAVSGKADKLNVDPNGSDWIFPTWNSQGIITGKLRKMYTPKITINGKIKEYPDARGNGDVPPFWAPQSAGTAGQILKSTGSVPVWADDNYVTSADVKTQVEAYNYMDQEDAEVISTSLNDLEDKIEELSGKTVDLSGYYTSAQTEEAITSKNYITSAALEDYALSADVTSLSAATAGKADAANVTANTNKMYFPVWSSQGVITGITGSEFKLKPISLNGGNQDIIVGWNNRLIGFYAPTTSGNPGDILVSTGSGAPVWSALTFITSADVKTQVEAYNYATTAKVESAYTILDEHITDVEQVAASALTELHDAIELFKPVLIYSGNPGFYAINSSALTTWQVEGLDLSEFKYIRFYIKASDIGFNDSNNFTAPMYVDVILDPEAKSSQYDAYLGVTSNICAGNRNRSYHVIAAVDSTKTKVQLLYQTTLWDITASSAAADGRYCYKIEGYRF